MADSGDHGGQGMATSQPRLQIVTADDTHLAGMVALHTRAFAGEFLTLLGPSVLRAFYRFYVRQAQGIALVAVEADSAAVRGLVCGGDPGLRRRFIRRCAGQLIRGAVQGACRHRRVRQRLSDHGRQAGAGLSRRLRGRPDAALTNPEPNLPPGRWSSLLSICADPDHRGRGIGRLLMEGFRAESRRRGYRLMRLSVHNDNTAAIQLYEQCGWSIASTSTTAAYFTRATDS